MPTTPPYCDMCGGNLRPGARVCGSCGTPVPGAAPLQAHAAQANRPQAVIPRSGVNANSQRPGGQQSYGQPSQSRPVSSQSSAPVTIVINGQQTSGSGYGGMRGYRCGTCGSFVYDGGPSCGCGWGIADFLALGLEMEAVDDLFVGDDGGAAEDLLLAGMISGGGGVGYRPYGGGMFGYGAGGLTGGGFVTDMLLIDALDQRDDQQAFQQGYQAGEQADYRQDGGEYQGQGYGDQGYAPDGYGGGDFAGQGDQDYREQDYQEQDYPDPDQDM